MDNSMTIVTEHLWAHIGHHWVNGREKRGWYTLSCPQLNFHQYPFMAKKKKYVRAIALRLLEERAVWLSRSWIRDLKKLTRETVRLTRELEKSR
jgi:hypothetical protein